MENKEIVMRQVILSIMFVGLLCGLIGCGSGKREMPQTAPVAGTVYLDGKPLDGAEVRFYSQDFVGFAITGADGKYELTQGAIPGENRVTIRKVTGDYDPDPESGMDAAQMEFAQESALGGASEITPGMRAKLPGAAGIPQQFSDPEKTQLKMNVPEEGIDSADFKITSK